MPALPSQPVVNIGTAGHVDHGKTTLLQSLTDIWASKHSEELRRGITIRLGYADTAFYKCPSCESPQCYGTDSKCKICGSKTEFLRAVSFIDCPGHEVLMTTMLSGAAVMDGSLLVIAADAPVPQLQTREHLAALNTVNVKNIVIVQNKIDLVTKEKALENYQQIKMFVKGTPAENAPIIPVSAQHDVNIDVLIGAIEKHIPTPKRDMSKPPLMHVVRSFDVNKPGTQIEDLAGGVIGGSIIDGKLEVEDDIVIIPGLRVEKPSRAEYQSLSTKIQSLHAGGKSVKQAVPGGLVGVGTLLDPSLSRADGLIGNLVGKQDQLPPVRMQLTLRSVLFENVVGTAELMKVDNIKLNETLVVNSGTSVTTGTVIKVKKDKFEIALKKPVCAPEGARIALSRRISGKWRLIGYGMLSD